MVPAAVFFAMNVMEGFRNHLGLAVICTALNTLVSVPLAAWIKYHFTRPAVEIMENGWSRHEDVQRAQRAIDDAFAALARVEATMSRFRPDSDIGRANRLASRAPVAITPATFGVLESALQWARASDGAFDPAIGRVTELNSTTLNRSRSVNRSRASSRRRSTAATR